MTKQENRFILEKLGQDGSGMAVGDGVLIQNMFLDHMDHPLGEIALGTSSKNILNPSVINQRSGKIRYIAKLNLYDLG